MLQIYMNCGLGLFHQLTLMHNFLYSLTICLLHYYPRHVSSINVPIFRRKNCIHTASGVFALCKRLHSTLVESGLQSTNFNAQFSLFIKNMFFLHYCPRHVSSFNVPIFRRKNCIHTAPGVFALCKRLHSTLVESGLVSPVLCRRLQRAKIPDAV